MPILLTDSLSLFDSRDSFMKHSDNTPNFIKTSSQFPILDSYNEAFSCLCNQIPYLAEYKTVCFAESNLYFKIYNKENKLFPVSHTRDLVYYPYLMDAILSALYTATYLQYERYYVSIPELVHLKHHTNQITPEQILNWSSKSSSNNNDQKLTILYPILNNDHLNNEDRKNSYKKFNGIKVKRYWDRFYKSLPQKCQDTAIPFLLCDLCSDLLHNNSKLTGITGRTIDTYTYFDILIKGETCLTPEYSVQNLHGLLKQYKLESIFKLRFITNFIKRSFFIDDDGYQDPSSEEISHLLSLALQYELFPLADLLHYIHFTKTPLGYSNNVFGPPYQKISTIPMMSGLHPDIFDIHVGSNYFPAFPYPELEIKFLEDLSSTSKKFRKFFFIQLYKYYGDFNSMIPALYELLFQLDYFKSYFLNYDDFFCSHQKAKIYEKPASCREQRKIAKNVLKNYWNY